MRYEKVQSLPGWIYDSENEDYISPKGRTASYPGYPFTGSVSEKVLDSIKLVIEEGDTPFRAKEEIGEDTLAAEVVKTITFGDVTVNFIKVR